MSDKKLLKLFLAKLESTSALSCSASALTTAIKDTLKEAKKR